MSCPRSYELLWFALVICVALIARPAEGQFTFGDAVNVGSLVNSPEADFASDMSDDGGTLLFTRTDLSAFEPTGDIWLAIRDTASQAWAEPKPLGPEVNTSAFEGSPALSADGLQLYFSDAFAGMNFPRRPGGVGDGDIWVATRATINDEFGVPVNLGETVNSRREDTAPDITSDGLSLFFHSVKGDGVTNEIWATTRPDAGDPLGWGPPVKLGATVNSSFGAAAPTLSGDGRTMFFVSYRPGGLGMGDIWMTTRTDTSDPLGWGPATNLGPTVNSSLSDYSPDISADGSTLLFSSDRTGSRGSDLWEVSVVADTGKRVLAVDSATLQPAGPLPFELGESLVTIEGETSRQSASYGVTRFDVSGVKAQFDSDYGEGSWTVEAVDLLLTQVDPFFNAFDGSVEVFFTSNDDTDISQQTSTLTYPFDGDFPDAQSALVYEYSWIGDGQRETHPLFDANGVNLPGGTSLASDLLSDDIVTLALVEADPFVSATYAGFAHRDFVGPALRITARQTAVALQAGDADQDFDFDQLDLVQVQIGGKYLTGQGATWGEGDWNGAPGGSPGAPPAGDGLFNQLDIVAAQQAAVYLKGPYAGRLGDGMVAVPEPNTSVLLAVAFLTLFLCRGTGRRSV